MAVLIELIVSRLVVRPWQAKLHMMIGENLVVQMQVKVQATALRTGMYHQRTIKHIVAILQVQIILVRYITVPQQIMQFVVIPILLAKLVAETADIYGIIQQQIQIVVILQTVRHQVHVAVLSQAKVGMTGTETQSLRHTKSIVVISTGLVQVVQ